MTLPKAFALLWLAPAVLLAGSGREFTLTWKDLAPLAVDRKAVAVLTDGAELKGKVLAVEPEGLRMQVTRKGETLVPRAAVTSFASAEPPNAGARSAPPSARASARRLPARFTRT